MDKPLPNCYGNIEDDYFHCKNSEDTVAEGNAAVGVRSDKVPFGALH